MALSGITYHEGEQSHYRHCTSGVNVSNTWFLIRDTKILKIRNAMKHKGYQCFLHTNI